MGIVFGFIQEGLVYAIVSFGVYITYKILDFPDMTVDGSFPLGMAITAVLIINGFNPFFAMFVSFLAGALCGIATGVINIKCGIRDLLSGIIVMTGLYSIQLHITKKANLPIYNKMTLFDNPAVNSWIDLFFKTGDKDLITIRSMILSFVLLIIVLVCKFLLDKYLETKNGYLLKSVGDNEVLVTSLAIDKGNVKILGLAIANAFVSFAGAVCVQYRGFFDISLGTGTLVIAVANVIIGMQIMKKFIYIKATTAIIFGSIIYRACISYAMLLGFEARDLKLITAILLLLILSISRIKKRMLR